jgi:succinate dehydrogenase / fumarate reductase cytochrome b subunit
MLARFKWDTGSVAWAMHRLTGIAIVAYLVLHVYTMSKLQLGPEAYQEAIAPYGTVRFKVAEALLWGACVYHGLNGIRVILVDFAGLSKLNAALFWIFMGIAASLFVFGGWAIVASGFMG